MEVPSGQATDSNRALDKSKVGQHRAHMGRLALGEVVQSFGSSSNEVEGVVEVACVEGAVDSATQIQDPLG